MANLGFVVLLLASLLFFYTVAMAAGAGFGKNPSLFASARYGIYGTTALTSIACFLLVYGLSPRPSAGITPPGCSRNGFAENSSIPRKNS